MHRFVLVVGWVCFGCGSASTAVDAALIDAGSTADARGVDAGPAGAPLTVRVRLLEADGTRTDAAGAQVALDVAGEPRREAMTGADGRVTFEGVSRGAESVDVTAYLAGRQLASRLGVEASETEVALELAPRVEESDFVQLGGMLTNPVDPSNFFLISASTQRRIAQRAGTDWSLGVRRGLPVTIVVAELGMNADPVAPVQLDQSVVRFARFERAAVTAADATVTLDVQAGMIASAPFMGSLSTESLPAASRLRAEGASLYVLAVVRDGAFVGYSERITAQAGATGFDFRGAYAPSAAPAGQLVSYVSLTGPNGNSDVRSELLLDGVPSGAIATPLLEPAEIALPPATGLTTPPPLSTRIVWRNRAGEGPNGLRVSASFGRWQIDFPDTRTELRIPALPSLAAAAQALGTEAVGVTLGRCEREPSAMLPLCRRYAASRGLLLQP